MTKPLVTVPVLLIVMYLTAKAGFPWWICFFTSWGVMDWVGMLHDAINKAVKETIKV